MSKISEVLPLSPLQQGLLFHALYDKHAAADVYQVQMILELGGSLDGAALKRAAEALLQRHPNLRAAFFSENVNQPRQVIPRDVTLAWHEVDLADLTPEQRQAQWQQLLADDYARRFDPARAPLLRFTLVRFAPQRHRLVLTYHHLLLDGWSMSILLQEFFAGYRGDADALPRPTPYRDYLAWIKAQDPAETHDAWSKYLAGLNQATRLYPTLSGSAPALPSSHSVDFPAPRTQALMAQARQLGVTLNTLVQAAWGLLLGCLTGSDDVVFGIT